MSILSFADKEVEQFFKTGQLKNRIPWRQLKRVVLRKLDILHYAVRLDDLRSPPGNRLEALKGNWAGFFSIRINDQWRIVFQWTEQGPKNVRIVDYH